MLNRIRVALLALALASSVLASSALAQSVQQSGPVTRNHVACWTTSGVIQDCGSSADSPLSSLGVTNEGGAGICVASQRASAAGRNLLCLSAATAAAATISVQNYGTAAPQGINLDINGTIVAIPTGGGSFIFGNAPFTPGDVPCFQTSAGVVQDCGLALSAGTVTSGIWGATPIAIGFGGTGATTAATARTALGLGTMAVQNANNVAIIGGAITGMSAPVNPTDVAIKSYVDATASGLNILPQSRLATAAVLPNSPTYANGTLGVGATLTAGSNSTLTVDGTIANLNDVILVKNQAAAAQNGVYTVTTAGSGSVPWVLTRASYFDQAAEMKAGSYTLITAGTVNPNSSWTMQAAVTTVGTDPLTFVQFSAASSGTVTNVTILGGTGITTTGACNISINGSCTINSTATTLASGAAVIASRAAALAQNLSALSVVETLGYGAAADGGGAIFNNVGAAAFTDTYITGATLAGGSGYTAGTYLGVPLGGGIGLGCEASVTVAGGAVTAVSIVIPCAGYAVGDVLTTPNSFIGNTGSGFSYTVTSISTPKASFTDLSGTHFQFVTGQPGRANVLQFGCKGDWNGTDGSATNNAACIWSAAAWASVPMATAASKVNGNQLIFPRGSYMSCGAANFGGGSVPYYLTIPQGVVFSGVGIGGSTLVDCAADSPSIHYVQLCDSNYSVGQFGCKIEKMTLNGQQVAGSTSGVAMIYSNAGQQFTLGETLEILSGNRSCVKYEIGKGGAANDIWIGVDCEQNATATTGNAGFILNASGTQHILRDVLVGNPGGAGLAIQHLNGRLIADGLDIEAYVTGLLQNVSTSQNVSVYRNVQQNSNNCSQAISLLSTNTPGNILFENVISACPVTITNGQSGGSNLNANIVKPITCVSGACS